MERATSSLQSSLLSLLIFFYICLGTTFKQPSINVSVINDLMDDKSNAV